MKIELLSCSVFYFGNFCKLLQPSRRTAPRSTQPPQRAAVSASRATVEQSSESKGSASICRYLMIMVAASRGVKPHTGQPQSATCESTLAPGSTVAQPHLRSPLPRDKPAAQAPAIGASGTQQRRRCTHRDGIGQENTPVAPKACMNSACERAGMYGARAHRKLASAQLTRSSNAQHRTDFKSNRA